VSDLTWYSDRDGLLGTGPSLLLSADNLAEGTRIIRLEAKDSQGQSSFSDFSVETPSEESVDETYDTVSFDIFYDPLTLPAELAVAPNLGFFTVEGADEVLTDTLEVSNLGDGALSWTAASDAANVTLSSTSGDAPATVVVSVNTTGLTYGLYEGAITFTPTDPSLEPVTIDYFINVEVAPLQTLIVSKAGNGSGTVTSEPEGIDCGATCSISFAQDSVITLTATPATNSVFGGWSGACTDSEETCVVTMDDAKSVTATFNSFQVVQGSKVYLPLVQR
jgi:hypothetical protein